MPTTELDNQPRCEGSAHVGMEPSSIPAAIIRLIINDRIFGGTDTKDLCAACLVSVDPGETLKRVPLPSPTSSQ